MIKTDIARTVATLLCTVVVSATCVLGAVGPAANATLRAAPAAIVA